MEREHMNMVGYKLVDMVKSVKLEELVVLTTDGSPHCVQLHMLVEEVRSMLNAPGRVEHLLIHKGRLHRVEAESVKLARYLTKIQRLRETVRL